MYPPLHEATAGFEPAHQAFAEPCLTTWPRRHEGKIILAAKTTINP